MSVEVATQVVTLVLAVLAIIWHQQRTSEKLRDEFSNAIDRLRDAVVSNGQRIAHIEGFLRIGMPAEATRSEPSPASPAPSSSSVGTDPTIEPATGT